MDVEENVEDFLERVKQLDLQRQREDDYRRRKLEEDIMSYSSRDPLSISLPNPVARSDSDEQYRSIPNSESLQNFNKSVSREYRIDMDDLVYESAYNYEKSQKSPNRDALLKRGSFKASDISTPDNDDSQRTELKDNDFSSSGSFRVSGSISKKYDNIPDIIRFDDVIGKPTQNYKSSRYSKFNLSDEQKKSLDSTIQGLIGTEHKVEEVKDDGPVERVVIKPLVRERKGGQFPSLSSPIHSKDLQWSSAAKQKPSLAPPATLSNTTSQLKRSPRKTELTSPIKPEITSPIKKSPAKLDFSRYTSDEGNTKAPPPLAPKPLGFKSNGETKKNSWLDSAIKNKTSTSTSQAQDTTSKIHLESPKDKQASWLGSAVKNSSSTSQWQDTTPKIHVNVSKDKQASWLDSAMKNTPHQEFEVPKSKIKPIVPSKSNTLSEKLKNEEMAKQKQESTLKELESRKLNHIESPVRSVPKLSPQLSSSSSVLKKVRPPLPIRKQNTQDEEPDFLKQRLSPTTKHANISTSSSASGSRSASPAPEAVSHKSKLKPALPARKPSLEVPEALKKAEKLKPALPKRKPSYKIPEALSQKEQLRQAAKVEKAEEPTPEGVHKKTQLKPALPKRKPSVKSVEALEQLNKIKAKASSPPPVTKPKPRVFSNSKEILQNQLGSLKSTKREQIPKEEASINLEKILKRAQTDTELKPVRLPFMAQGTDDFPKIPKKASTFDNADLKSDKVENLEHLTKKRAKGPKRRAPKKV